MCIYSKVDFAFTKKKKTLWFILVPCLGLGTHLVQFKENSLKPS